MDKKIIKTAKQLFDAEVLVSGAKYIDEVADIHYYYVEIDDKAYLFMADEVNLSYDLAIFPKASVLLKAHPFEFSTTVSPILDAKDANKLFWELTAEGEKDFEGIYNFCYYCDFLMQNTAFALDGRSFKDEYEEVEYEEVEKEKPETEEKSKVVESMVQYLRDALTFQKNVVWSMICNRFENDKKNIDMKRIPNAIADAYGYQFDMYDCGHIFAIVELEGNVKINYRPECDDEQETYLDWKDMSYEALVDILYAMA